MMLTLLIGFSGLILALPLLWFILQILMACWFRNTPQNIHVKKARHVVVLIPAHNESVNILPTLHSVGSQAFPGLRTLVVADNCSDDTANIARAMGAEVVERINPTLRGKGYALDFGVQYLKRNPPEVVVILDADCLLEPGVLQQISNAAVSTSRPVQALYLMRNSGKVSIKAKVAEFAWLVKNHVRPRGLLRMNLPCQLTGSGMALPWPLLRAVPLATGEIVEDMKLGIAMTTIGHPPLFCESAVVSSTFPGNVEGVKSQRTRWEHGHLAMIWKEGIPKIFKGLANRDVALFFLALDLCIPPLALLILLAVSWEMVAVAYWSLSGNAWPMQVGTAALGLTGLAVLSAWYRFGRRVISGRELLMAPVYIASKLPVYFSFLIRRQADWVRSKRDHEIK